MKNRLTWITLIPLLVGLVAFGLGSSQSTTEAAPANPLANIPVTGTVENGGTFQGTLDIVSFATQSGQIVATGLLDGTLRNSSGGTIGTVEDELVTNIPVELSPGDQPRVCRILDLTLGPLDLNLLGLRVQLSQVDLLITAIRGPGNLLGNLLCAIVGLLDGGGPLDQIVNLLNRIVDLLGSLTP